MSDVASVRTPSAGPALELLHSRDLVVLTGAGVSTDSGIPDYRGPNAPARMPMTFQEFVATPQAQQRYWARSHLGWSKMLRAEPNAAHHAIAQLDAGLVITQNVDGLHERVGTANLVALHGRVSEVVCLDCRRTSDRRAVQERLTELNSGWLAAHQAAVTRPDGDVELEDTVGFVVPGCDVCDGRLKPDVVFFGENVPPPRVVRCMDAVDALTPETGALVCIGTSLTVMSGLRFVRRAAKAGVPVVIANHGITRGDELATYAVETGSAEFATELAQLRRAYENVV